MGSIERLALATRRYVGVRGLTHRTIRRAPDKRGILAEVKSGVGYD
jgi:hypothetical protein